MALNFFDVSRPVEAQPGADTLPPLHHFRDHTLKSNINVTFLLIFKFASHGTKEVIVSAAN